VVTIPEGAPPLDGNVLEESGDVEAGARQRFEAPPPLAPTDSEDTVLVRLHGNFKTECRRFARDTPITKMWKVIGAAMRGGARLRVSPSGQEVAQDATLGQIADGNHLLTLELRCPAVGGGAVDDQELIFAAFRGDKEVVVAALSRGANVNAMDDILGDTPLTDAAIRGGHR